MDLLRPAPSRTHAALVGAFIVALAACASTTEERSRDDERSAEARTEEGRATRRGDSEATSVGAPGARSPSREDTGIGTPRRAASQRLVEEGKGYWIAGRLDEARSKLQEALRLDGSNGAAYYYLAVVAADAREWSDAEGYHAQAEALLRGREDYRMALDDLAERIAARR